MKTYDKITECFAVLFDPAKPDRRPAVDVHVVTMIDLEDGSPPFMDPRQPVQVLTMEAAKARGLGIPQIAAAFDTDTNAEIDKLRREKAELEKRVDTANSGSKINGSRTIKR